LENLVSIQSTSFNWFSALLASLAALIIAAAATVAIALIVIYPQLPSVEVLTDYRPKVPLRIYTADGHLMGEFGEERRNVITIQDTPALIKQAVLAAEDERFYEHSGIDTRGIARAALSNLAGGGKRQGASTITMQVARNFFLSSEKTLTRKLYEVLLAFKIESSLSKDEIFQLYLNQIYLGQRAYGFASAAQIYFGKSLKDISIAEAAMLAGLPKAPSAFNPVANPKRAKLRQQYVLRRMHELKFIDDTQLADAKAATLQIKHNVNEFDTPADYVAEMVRQAVVEQFPDDAYSRGYSVTTTIVRKEQQAAYDSLRKAVLDYDQRHGYRGAEAYVDMGAVTSDTDEQIEDLLQDFDASGDLIPALILDATPTRAKLYVNGGELITIEADGLKFAARMLDKSAPPNKQLRRGAVVRLQKTAKGWQILQLPDVQAAFVAGSPIDGAVRALVGGWDFSKNKYNRVTQAWRQPGSSFKPFIYSAGLEKGYSPISRFDDAPFSVSASETGSQAWEPQNYDGKYDGPMSMRTALAKSKNMVSIRLLQSIGTHYAQDYVTRFGYTADKHPPYLTMALGAGAVTPWQQLAAYSVFANGGYRVSPYVIKEIRDEKGHVIAQTQPDIAGDDNLRVIDARNAWLMDSMMRDVVRRGTATRAMVLKRGDLAGKTGTTNDYIDAWFCGYQATVVGIAWIGFDQPKRMGSGETGGGAALPIWIGYMQTALAGVPESFQERPSGLTPVNAQDAAGRTVTDFIYSEFVPPEADEDEESEPEPQQAPAPVRDSVVKPITQ
jgi:penicillin-binding protein 1A